MSTWNSGHAATGAPTALTRRVELNTLREMKTVGRTFAMLTAYDHIMAALAERAGVHSLLVGDSLASVVLGEQTTRAAPLDLMVVLSRAVRRGAPRVWLVGDLPNSCISGSDTELRDGARRFMEDGGCDAVKAEVPDDRPDVVDVLVADGLDVIAHLGLRPQSVTSPDGYRAQARDAAGIEQLVRDAVRAVEAGAAMLLLEAVPAEAARAVRAAVDVPVVGCGAGPDCDGHVVVTHDMLGLSLGKVPRFVPVLADVAGAIEQAMRSYVDAVETGRYPAPEHVYPLRRPQGARQDP